MTTAQDHIYEAQPASAYPADTKSAPGHDQQQYNQQPYNQQQYDQQPQYSQPVQPQQVYSGQMQPQQQQQPMAYAPGTRMVVPLDRLGDQPQDIDCPNCHSISRSRVESHSSGMTIVAGVLIGLLCICLAWIPCAAHFAYDTEWYCQKCGCKLAYKLHDQGTVVCHLQGPTAVPSYHQGGPPQQQQYQQQAGAPVMKQ